MELKALARLIAVQAAAKFAEWTRITASLTA
jgi:hypothetical protein